MKLALSAVLALATMFVAFPARAQDCAPGRDLLTIPEIQSKPVNQAYNYILRGVITLADEQRSLAGSATGAPCNKQQLRYFKGYSLHEPMKAWPSTGDILPGPTLRARVGSLVQLAFLNQINPGNFPNTLDQGEQGKTPGCDTATATRRNPPPATAQIYPRNDAYPNCLHGSSTANIHFHGTHTTPSTTGDNVLLFVRPALRQGETLAPDEKSVMQQFTEFFQWCETNGTPSKWTELPASWQSAQQNLLQTYDKTAPYKGVVGALPAGMQLWPKNAARLKDGLWPQYSVGGFPYCFRLPTGDEPTMKMGQAPGTHWYHAHKHGSTALNVGNGMTGAFIIEGEYDNSLRNAYSDTHPIAPPRKNWGLNEQVLVIQQLETALNLLSGRKGVPPPLSVNGRLNPIVTMKPNQVQLWRIINGAGRSFVQFGSFPKRGPNGVSVAWRQIAQDGVQFHYQSYLRAGTNGQFNMATGNRVDLLVRAPAQEADYALTVITSVSDVPNNPNQGTPVTLLTVRVKADDKKIDPPMDFIDAAWEFPISPRWLGDINEPVKKKRELWFNTAPAAGRGGGKLPLHQIDGKLFDGHDVEQTMTLNTVEEWTVYNQTVNIAHPFHIHVNPFQITEVFQPNSPEASIKGGPCYADPLKPDTWKQCTKMTAPFLWWDVFAIPTARADTLPTTVCTQVDKCPADIQKYTACSSGNCTVTIPGFFRMKSRFVDFTGQYVIHCHILAHEDRGMMQLVEVAPKSPSQYEHH